MNHSHSISKPWEHRATTMRILSAAMVCILCVAAIGMLSGCNDKTGGTASGSETASVSSESAAASESDAAIANAFENKQSDISVQGKGEVIRVLSDDNDGSRHQRFILELPSGQTLLIAHNIDIANRLENLQVGDQVAFSGEYVWNEEGGIVHWTHRDPNGTHPSGWLEYNGAKYQ